jgi:hypothetical protein
MCKYYEVVLYPERERGERKTERGEGYRKRRGEGNRDGRGRQRGGDEDR